VKFCYILPMVKIILTLGLDLRVYFFISFFSGNRELPPRFQKKQQQQQMQQKDSIVSSESGRPQSPASLSTLSAGGSSSPQGLPMSFQSTTMGGAYVPMMPPVMLGHAPGGMVGPKSAPGMTDDISLRPMRNFTPILRPNTPATLPKSAQSAHPQTNNRMQVSNACVLTDAFDSIIEFFSCNLLSSTGQLVFWRI
jgi:hypothetical protein